MTEKYNPADITRFEDKNKIKFPAAYKAILKEANGAAPSRDRITVGREEYGVSYFLSWNTKSENYIADAYKYLSSSVQGELIPFAVDSFGNYFCFLYGGKGGRGVQGEPTIVFWFHEQETVEPVANDFASFLRMLS